VIEGVEAHIFEKDEAELVDNGTRVAAGEARDKR